MYSTETSKRSLRHLTVSGLNNLAVTFVPDYLNTSTYTYKTTFSGSIPGVLVAFPVDIFRQYSSHWYKTKSAVNLYGW